MPSSRRRSKHLGVARPLSSSYPQAETRGPTRWIVRQMPGSQAVKTYICPGCGHPINPGTPHLVVWPSTPSLGTDRAVDERRHWHVACWRRPHDAAA